MKNIILLLALFPFSALAQNTQTYNHPEISSLKVHYEKINMHNDNLTLTNGANPGDMNLTGDNISIDGPINVKIDKPDRSQHKPVHKDWIVVAYNVEISNAANPASLKADVLSYNSKAQTGVLLGHITLVENGTKKKIGKRAEIDLCNDEYRIVSIR